MKNGTHYSLQIDLSPLSITVSAFSFSQSARGFVVTSQYCGQCVLLKSLFYILIGNTILAFGTLTIPFQHDLPKINGETPLSRL